MKNPYALSLAKRLLASHFKHQSLSRSATTAPPMISNEELIWAQEILATHLDACLKQGVHPDLAEAVEEAVAFAARHERAYEPIPEGSRWHCALVMMEEQDAD